MFDVGYCLGTSSEVMSVRMVEKSKPDPIIEELRRVRESHAAMFNYDLYAIYKDLKREEQSSKRKKVSFRPKRVESGETKAQT